MTTQHISNKEYRGLVQEICRQITKDQWMPDYIVGITRGGLIPATMISHYLQKPLHCIKISLREEQDTETNAWMPEDAFGYVDLSMRETYQSRWDPQLRKKILIVDDINDSGDTINWLMNDWMTSCFPGQKQVWNSIWGHNVKFAVVVDNLASKSNVKMSYVGKEIRKSSVDWIVFPYEEWWIK